MPVQLNLPSRCFLARRSYNLSWTHFKLYASTRLISNHRPVSETTINLSILETSSNQCRDFKEFKQILSQMILTGFIKNTFAARRLLQFSTNDLPFIHLDYSFQIFNVIENPDASIYNIMMMAYLRRNYPHRAIHLYKLMLYRSVGPNVYTYPFLVEACAIRDSKLELEWKQKHIVKYASHYRSEGRQMHNHVLKLGFDSDVHVRSTFVDMYADCYMSDYALQVFHEGPMMGSFVWYSLLEGCKAYGDMEGAEHIYNLMPEKDTTASAFMIASFGRSGEYEKAEQLINEIPKNDTVSWSALINCYQARYREMYEEGIYIFYRMHANGMSIDELVVEAVLLCCTNYGSLADIEIGKLIHCLVVKIGLESDVELQNSLIRMYSAWEESNSSEEKVEDAIYSAQKLFNAARWLHQSSWTAMLRGYLKCGFDENVKALFEDMPVKDPVSWTMMICYYALHNCFSESLALFQEMLRSGIRLDEDDLYSIIMNLPRRFAAMDLGKCIHAYLIKNGYSLTSGGTLNSALSHIYKKLWIGGE